jgi:hypothetical protein
MDPELAHQIGAVNLDRARRDAQIIGNRLVAIPLRQTLRAAIRTPASAARDEWAAASSREIAGSKVRRHP